jgi:hypothetical protein
MAGDGSTVVDFGIYNIDNPAGRAFVNGYEKASSWTSTSQGLSGIKFDNVSCWRR